MITSEHGLEAIEQFEGKRLKAYLDSVNIPTIGVGHTGPDVYIGQTITEAECRALLREDVQEAEDSVNACVKVPLTQDQFDALVSFVFNVGGGAFKGSTLLKKLNAGDYEGAANQFQRWSKAGGKDLPGLLKRRMAEANIFRSEYA
jgi:lysozyme